MAEARYEITVDAQDTDGDVILAGSNSAQVYVGEVTFAQIELNYTFGELDIAVILPGDDFIASIEIEGIELDNNEEIAVVHGPGFFIEQLAGGSSTYLPGTSSMKMFSIETVGNNTDELQSWFDGLSNPRTGSLVVNNLAGSESYRWNMFEMLPLFYEVSPENQT